MLLDPILTTMNKSTHFRTFGAILAATGLLLGASARAHVGDETGWYLTGTLERSASISDAGPLVNMGGPVSIQGRVDYGTATSGALALGKEFRRERQGEEPTQYRLEGELWAGRLPREAIRLGLLSSTLSDRVNARALFLGGAWRFATTENSRWWLGGAIGLASVSVPDASASLTAACGCARAADDSGGLAWRVKMQGERITSEHSAVFLELAHTRLPSVSSVGTPSTRYGAWGVTSVGVGMRYRFH